jgi:plastocyanin
MDRTTRALSRREFLRTAATGVTVAAVGGSVLSCDSLTSGPMTTGARGDVLGEVVDAQGVLQASLGRLTLMYDSGFRTGLFADTDATGHFSFARLMAGNYQVRFDAPGVAHMLEDVPVTFKVVAGQTTAVRMHAERGPDDNSEIQIYAGDTFFQAQPFGTENGETVVKLGVKLCWYNIGTMVHSITGGPWADSPDLRRGDNFMWIADRVGTFGYRCRYHGPQGMQATLRVIA